MITYSAYKICSLASLQSIGRGSCCLHILRRFLSGDPTLLERSEAASEDCSNVVVIPEFLTAKEGDNLLEEISRTLRGKKYLYDHWDGAIQGYKETEKRQWNEDNIAVMERLKSAVESATVDRPAVRTLHEVHVLDLAHDGFIKPHIDSVKFCGDVIGGVSLLSSCVMIFQHDSDVNRWIRALLPPLSLYIMRGAVRYNYTHAIPQTGSVSCFQDRTIVRDRRISVISRTHPP